MNLRLTKRINHNSLISSYIQFVFKSSRLPEKALRAVGLFKLGSKQDPQIAYD